MSHDQTQQEAFERILEVLSECGETLFLGSGLTTTRLEWDEERAFPGGSVVAMLGYAGEALRGSLVLQTGWDVAKKLGPDGLYEGPVEDTLRDVMGELANQLLGRLKNRLLPAGVVLNLATPTTACGSEVRLGSASVGRSRWIAFSCGAGPILIRFDASFAPDFRLGDLDAAPEAAPMTEGDLMLF